MTHPRISITTISSWTWTVEQDIAWFKQEGVAAMGVPTTKFAGDSEKAVAALAASGLTFTALSAGTGGGMIESEDAALAELAATIDMAQRLRAPSLYFLTGPTKPRMATDEAYAALIRCLPKVNAYAHERGVRLAIEHNSISSRAIGFVHTVAGVAEIARAADVDICLELQNCWYEPDLPRLLRENVDRLCIVQVSDFLIDEPLRNNRRVPGDGSMPLEWMIGEVLEAGYKGFFEIEVLGPAIEQEGYDSAMRRSVEWLAERLTKWGA
ncbi:MAG: sugar phosphate isomerase/epimerase [Novosphingobium sp.]|nr:sugar phosphate isomerase/epimerase [Novosphingobium sp.]